MSKDSVATVRMVGGQLVLDDPFARAVIQGVAKHNCHNTLNLNLDRVTHFARRIRELGHTADEMVIVILNVDDPTGGQVADMLMPGHDWQHYRDLGQVPFARGLAVRAGIQELVDELDPEAAKTLRETKDQAAVVVMDYGSVEVFRADLPTD